MKKPVKPSGSVGIENTRTRVYRHACVGGASDAAGQACALVGERPADARWPALLADSHGLTYLHDMAEF